MKNLLLPYAYDSTGNLVHINNAHKEEIYKCPECGSILSLNISKIPEGQKYHRRNHFSHPKGNPDNGCTESFLHKLFKERTANCIQKKMVDDEQEFLFSWQCKECGELHYGNLLKKAKSVHLEYDLGVCQPDIALLDKDGKVIITIEIVVTHKPEPEVLEYYKNQGIACLQINVIDFDDCEKVEYKLSQPDSVNLCPTPNCERCGRKMHKMKMVIGYDSCWTCGEMMNVAIIKDCTQRMTYSPADFKKDEVDLANINGAKIKRVLSKKQKDAFYVNVCDRCGHFGKQFLHNDYFPKTIIKEIDLGYKCYHCVEKEKMEKIEQEREKERKLNERLLKDGIKQCPKCGKRLVVRKSNKGYFYGCKDYPNCRYTENIVLEE